MNTETTESTSATAGDPHTVTIRRRIWQELVKIAGHQIDPENAEVDWEFGQVLIHIASIPIYRPSMTVSVAYISLEILEAAYGSHSVIYQTRPETHSRVVQIGTRNPG
jgi:hypothetical protein